MCGQKVGQTTLIIVIAYRTLNDVFIFRKRQREREEQLPKLSPVSLTVPNLHQSTTYLYPTIHTTPYHDVSVKPYHAAQYYSTITIITILIPPYTIPQLHSIHEEPNIKFLVSRMIINIRTSIRI